MDLLEEGSRSLSLGLYGQLDLILRNGDDEFRPAISEVSDRLESMFTDLCGDLLACCRSGSSGAAGHRRDFEMRREGAILILHQPSWFDQVEQRWRTGEDARSFLVDLSDFVREFFATARQFHDRLKAAIGGQDDPRLAEFSTWFEEQEAIVRAILTARS
jgi:hypothetical protein